MQYHFMVWEERKWGETLERGCIYKEENTLTSVFHYIKGQPRILIFGHMTVVNRGCSWFPPKKVFEEDIRYLK